jgi:bis(5'-nucleosyl)-tetraphosphatase (symmetrical)
MAVYAIGDVQGCFDPLQRLLEHIGFNTVRDRLWFTGDLVNRGPDSARVLRLVYELGDRAVCVLGNHDLHLLALAAGVDKKRQHDTLEDVFAAPDREALLAWLRTCPLLHHDANLGYTLVHAGLLPQWGLSEAQALAREVETALQVDPENLFQHMYGSQPARWSDELRGFERLRVIVNAFTRLRYCNKDGVMDLQQKGVPGSQPADLVPWFQVPHRRNRDLRVVFGHWSALGVYRGENVVSLDSGCAWGRTLTAARLDCDPPEFYDVPCHI